MSIEATIEIDTRELANDGTFCDIVSDIVTDVIRESTDDIESIIEDWMGNNFQEQLDMADHSGLDIEAAIEKVDPDDDDFINAVARALYNMARSYVGA